MKQAEALDILKTGKNVFITGEPGSGKTHLINEYISYLRDRGVEPAVTASTGIAATHIGGYTIHSWSGIGIKDELSPYEMESLHEKKYLVKRITNSHILIVDEVSMLDGKVLDTVDGVLRDIRNDGRPFGGMQVVFSGDFFQLPPVPSFGERVFAYESKAWKEARPVTCYLSEQFRQTDSRMHNLLKALRTGVFKADHSWLLESRLCNDGGDLPSTVTRLFSHNIDVDRINKEELNKLDEVEMIFEMETKGNKVLVEQIKRGCLSPEHLVLKKGAVVMCTKNNFEKGFYNGTIGIIKSFEKYTRYPIIETKEGKVITVSEMEWVIEEDGKVLAKVTQIPLRLAWAITVHKSQGVSLDFAVIDLSKSFEYGQGYVALSRVRTLEGLFCLGFNDRALQVHPDVVGMDRWFKKHSIAIRNKFFTLDTKVVDKMRKNFIFSVGGNSDKIKKAKVGRKKVSTYTETAILIEEVGAIEELAKKRGLKVSTIINHLEKLSMAGSVPESVLWRFWMAKGRSKKDLDKIKAVLDSSKGIKLGVIRKELGYKFSFEEIRLARMLLI